jgi:hypothetical protein
MECAVVSNAMDEVASVAADLRAWLEWEAMLGAEVLPRERVDRTPGPPIRARGDDSVRAPSNPSVRSREAVPRRGPVPSSKPAALPKPVVHVEKVSAPPPEPPAAVEKPPRAGHGLSAKWAKLIENPTTHLVSGPVGSTLMVVRAAGSSPEAEAMLERMLTNVLGLQRSEIAMVDLVRDARSPQQIGEGFRGILGEYRPQQVLVMGGFALSAIFGESTSMPEARGEWHALKWDGGEAPMRVTHHPEAILALGARGQSDPKREAFVDLKAVGARIS